MQQADHVAEEDAEDAEVEQRAADAQQPVLVELRGAGGPAELVVAVAPDVADDEDRQADVRDDHPQELVHRRAPAKVGMGSSGGSSGVAASG